MTKGRDVVSDGRRGQARGVTDRHGSQHGVAQEPGRGSSTRGASALRLLLVIVALWLLVSPFVLMGPSTAVAVKDLLAGGVLLAVMLAGALTERVRRLERATCVAVGLLLLVAAVLLEFGPGREAVARQWNEVVVGVLLLCIGASRTR